MSFVDHGLTGTNRGRPGLREAMAAVRAGDALVVSKLDRLARPRPDARDIADELTAKGVSLGLGGSTYDPADPVGRLLFTVLGMVAEFEADLIRMRTREGMAVARACRRLRGKQPNLSAVQLSHPSPSSASAWQPSAWRQPSASAWRWPPLAWPSQPSALAWQCPSQPVSPSRPEEWVSRWPSSRTGWPSAPSLPRLPPGRWRGPAGGPAPGAAPRSRAAVGRPDRISRALASERADGARPDVWPRSGVALDRANLVYHRLAACVLSPVPTRMGRRGRLTSPLAIRSLTRISRSRAIRLRTHRRADCPAKPTDFRKLPSAVGRGVTSERC